MKRDNTEGVFEDAPGRMVDSKTGKLVGHQPARASENLAGRKPTISIWEANGICRRCGTKHASGCPRDKEQSAKKEEVEMEKEFEVKPNAGATTLAIKKDAENNRELPESEDVKNSTSDEGAALGAVRKQAGESMDNMTQPNSGCNSSN